MQKTRYVNSQVGSAVNEKQEIRISSETHPEKQVSSDARLLNNSSNNFLRNTTELNRMTFFYMEWVFLHYTILIISAI